MGVDLVTTPALGELRRETGYGRIAKVEHDGKRNAHVKVKAEHLRQDVTGWADTEDVALWPLVQRAEREDLRVAYVVDVHRRRNVDVAIPFAELDRNDKVRDLVYLAVVDRDGAVLAESGPHPSAQQAATPPQERQEGPEAAVGPNPPPPTPEAQEEPQEGPVCSWCGLPLAGYAVERTPGGYLHAGGCPGEEGPRPADAGAEPAPTGDEEGPVGGPFTCPVEGCETFGFQLAAELVEHLRTAHELATGAPTPRPAVRGRRGPRVQEAKPWEPYNGDGSLNLGSYALTASLGTTELAYELVVERMRTDAAVRGIELDEVPFGQVKALARLLLRAADRTQAAVRADGRVDRMDNSHTRARGAIRSTLDVYPVPWGANDDERAAWLDVLVDHATKLLAIAIALVDPEEAPGE